MKKHIIICLMCIAIILTLASCKNKVKNPIEDTVAAANDSSNEQNDNSIDESCEDKAVNTEDDTKIYDPLEDVIPSPEENIQNNDTAIKENEQVDDKTNNYADSEKSKSIADYTDEDFIITNYDFEELPISTAIFNERSEDWSPANISISDLQNHIVSRNGLIIRGVKKENSTQYDSKDGKQWYSETPIEILEVYYGNANIGDTVLVYEKAVVWDDHKGEKYVAIEDKHNPMEKGTEYILFISCTEMLSRNGRSVFVPYEASIGQYGRGRYKITDKIKNAKSADDAGLTGFEKEVFNTYYYK